MAIDNRATEALERLKEFSAEIMIDAPAEKVWDTISDLDGYSEWNPFIYKASGKFEVGTHLKLWLRLHDGFRIKISTAVIHVQVGQEIRWLGHLLVPGLIDGEHRLAIEKIAPSKTVFRQHETYRGLLVSLFWWRLQRDAKSGFEAMNRALKHRLEQLNGKAR